MEVLAYFRNWSYRRICFAENRLRQSKDYRGFFVLQQITGDFYKTNVFFLQDTIPGEAFL